MVIVMVVTAFARVAVVIVATVKCTQCGGGGCGVGGCVGGGGQDMSQYNHFLNHHHHYHP